MADAELVGEGLPVLEELARPSPTEILLATDLHAGNVLRSERQLWLVIDPKPFIGDVTYDLVQHLHNGEFRLHADPMSLIKRLADLAEVDSGGKQPISPSPPLRRRSPYKFLCRVQRD